MLLLLHVDKLHESNEKTAEFDRVSPTPIDWCTRQTGKGSDNVIVISDCDRFVTKILPQFGFPSISVQSFVRKMYRWGFRQVSGQYSGVYRNFAADKPRTPHMYTSRYFRKDNLSLLDKMTSSTSEKRLRSESKGSVDSCDGTVLTETSAEIEETKTQRKREAPESSVESPLSKRPRVDGVGTEPIRSPSQKVNEGAGLGKSGATNDPPGCFPIEYLSSLERLFRLQQGQASRESCPLSSDHQRVASSITGPHSTSETQHALNQLLQQRQVHAPTAVRPSLTTILSSAVGVPADMSSQAPFPPSSLSTSSFSPRSVPYSSAWPVVPQKDDIAYTRLPVPTTAEGQRPADPPSVRQLLAQRLSAKQLGVEVPIMNSGPDVDAIRLQLICDKFLQPLMQPTPHHAQAAAMKGPAPFVSLVPPAPFVGASTTSQLKAIVSDISEELLRRQLAELQSTIGVQHFPGPYRLESCVPRVPGGLFVPS
jgi:HSF-type DNA-binding